MVGKSFLIVQHMEWEGPGQHLLAAFHTAGVPYRVLEAWHQAVPPADSYAGLIVLGGSPNVDEEEAFPYLKPLKERIRETITRGQAYLGFCLGHQLLGDVLGCKVGPLPRKSVGFIIGELTPAGMAHPAFQGLPPRLEMFKWHGQGVLPPLPHGVTILAQSAAAPVEALGVDDNPKVVGLQFDNHAGVVDVVKWLHHDAEWALAGPDANPEAIIAAAKYEEEAMGRWFSLFMKNFLRLALSD